MKRLVAPAALAAAALLAFAAHALLSVPGQVQRESGPGLAARIAGGADDIRYRRAVRLAARAAARGRNGVRIRSEAEVALARESQTAQAANLLGALALADAAADPANGSKYVGEAVSAFQAALRLDPGDEDAKYNLELLLTLRPKAATSSAERATAHGKHGRSNRAAPAPRMGY